jgi:hypothetical protein
MKQKLLIVLLFVGVIAGAIGVGVWVASRPIDGLDADAALETVDGAGSKTGTGPVRSAVDAAKKAGREIPKNQFVEKANGEIVPLAEAAKGELGETPEAAEASDAAALAEDAAVAAWDALVENFAATSDRSVTKEDRAKVNEALKRLPRERRRASAQSLLNLVSDGNFGVMRDVLFDPAQPTEVVDAVFNDLLNRPEEVKTPLLKEIAQDAAHANCAEARRILDVQMLGGE